MTRIKSVWFKTNNSYHTPMAYRHSIDVTGYKGVFTLATVCEGGIWNQARFHWNEQNMRWDRA
jgi:hypothetical protein